MSGRPRPPRLLEGDLRQPDRFSCGASVVVVARMLRDAGYAATAAPRFAEEVLAEHRRLTGVRSRGRLQVPWPRVLGTPPWAVARELTTLTGERHRVRLARRRVLGSAAPPFALYVGNRLLPRHVLLVVGRSGEQVEVYDPATGGLRTGYGAWSRPWFVVSPCR